MAIVGDTVPQALYLYDASGAPQSYGTYAALIADGWSITFYDQTGVAISSQPTITLPVAGVLGRNQIAYVLPSGTWTAKVIHSNALYAAAPAEFSSEGFAYDIDSIGSLIATSSGVAISETAFSATHEMYDGNSIYVSCSIPDAALSAIGAASLAAVDTITAQIKIDSIDSDNAATVTGLTTAITSDSVGNRVVLVTLAAFPAGLAVPDGGQQSLACTLHVKLTEGTKIITANSTHITIKWKATTT